MPQGCGTLKNLKPATQSRPSISPIRNPEQVSHEDVARKMRLDYSYAKGDRNLRIMDAVQGLFSHVHAGKADTRALLNDAANLISRQFSLREVSIGLKSAADGKYRYEVLVGYRKESEDAHRKLAYTFNEMYDEAKYKATILSKYTRLFLAEDEPYAAGEETTYSRPMMLKLRRKTIEDSIEGDYLDTNIFGSGDDLLGWIEISGTNGWKLPDIATIKWIEVIACIIGSALSPRFMPQGTPAGSPETRNPVQA